MQQRLYKRFHLLTASNHLQPDRNFFFQAEIATQYLGLFDKNLSQKIKKTQKNIKTWSREV